VGLTRRRRWRGELVWAGGADAPGNGFWVLALGAQDQVDSVQRRHADGEFLGVLDELR
jgi:hypothetical protein